MHSKHSQVFLRSQISLPGRQLAYLSPLLLARLGPNMTSTRTITTQIQITDTLQRFFDFAIRVASTFIERRSACCRILGVVAVGEDLLLLVSRGA